MAEATDYTLAYDIDEGSGATLTNKGTVGSAGNLTISPAPGSGGPTWETGPGSGLDADVLRWTGPASEQVASVTGLTDPGGTTTGTLAIRCTIVDSTTLDRYVFLGFGRHGVEHWEIYRFDSDIWVGIASGGFDEVEGSATAFDDGDLHWVVGVATGSEFQLWVDGTEIAADGSGDIIAGVDLTFFGIGYDNDDGVSGARAFAGDVAAVRVYDRALTPTEIGELGNTASPVTVTASPATIDVAAQAAAVAADPLTVTASPADITAQAQAVTADRAPLTIAAAPADVSVDAQAPQVDVDPLTVTADPADVTVAAQAPQLDLDPLAVTAQAAAVDVAARAVTVTAADVPVTINAAPATITVAAQATAIRDLTDQATWLETTAPDRFAGTIRPSPFTATATPDRFAGTHRPQRFSGTTRPQRFLTTTTYREDVMPLIFADLGPYTQNEVPEALAIRWLRTHADGSETGLPLHDGTDPLFTITATIEKPSGATVERECVVLDPDTLTTTFPAAGDQGEDGVTDGDDGWLRMPWADGDLDELTTGDEYSIQLAADNGTLLLKSQDVWQPEVNDGPAADVTLAA